MASTTAILPFSGEAPFAAPWETSGVTDPERARNGTSAIETTDLTRSFPTGVAVDSLSLSVAAGEVLALLGPNGAGKTTTARLLNGVLRADRGSARVLGLDPATDGVALRRRTGVLTEVAGLDERLTARENLEFSARARGLPRADAARRAGELLDRFGMGGRADSRVQGFSTGQRKRVALARALLHDPELLFLDEPTSGLDPTATRQVLELIESLAARGRTVVLCTHFLAEAGKLADRVAILHRGRLRAAGTTDEIAASLWDGLDLDLDLGRPADGPVVDAVRGLAGVRSVESTPSGMRAVVAGRDDVPRVVAAVVSLEAPVYAATPRAPTLEDVYFAVEAQFATDEPVADDDEVVR
jgi:ABC-2 type transport system ATP-binding protein